MDFVLDANILFSVLIKEGDTAELLMKEDFHLFSPEFLFEEFYKYRDLILGKTKRTESEFNEILDILKSLITIIPKEDFSEFIKNAEEISPDPNDVPYFALALKLNCGIWSNDKRMAAQNSVPVYSTSDLIDIFFR